MNRPNLSLSTIAVASEAEKLELLSNLLSSLAGEGIVYCATRDQTELIAEYLQHNGIDAIAYHAGLTPEKKRSLQEQYIAGNLRIIVATNALGMGIDKPNIRFIVHADMPGSITAYYQEIGRAGRDGKPAQVVLLFSPEDRRVQDYFIKSAQPLQTDFEKVLSCITPNAAGEHPNLTKIKSKSGIHPTLVTVILAELREQDFIEKTLSGRKQVYQKLNPPSPLDLSRYERQFQAKTAELESIMKFGRETHHCKMAILRGALGDEQPPACGRCDVCAPSNNMSQIAQNLDLNRAKKWLEYRAVPINATRNPKMSDGLALLKGEMRLATFVHFMKNRQNPDVGMTDSMQEILEQSLSKLKEQHTFSSIIAIPSRTWQQRRLFAEWVGKYCGASVELDLLSWNGTPEARQGELLNNDQRRENIKEKMVVTPSTQAPAGGTLLLLDDYVGSGSTLKEAVRVLRREKVFQETTIVPFTIASIRWRLGAQGMV